MPTLSLNEILLWHTPVQINTATAIGREHFLKVSVPGGGLCKNSQTKWKMAVKHCTITTSVSTVGDLKESVWIQHGLSVFIRPEMMQHEPELHSSTWVERGNPETDRRRLWGAHVCTVCLLPLSFSPWTVREGSVHTNMFRLLCWKAVPGLFVPPSLSSIIDQICQ